MHEFQTSKNQLRCGQPIQNSRNKVYRASLPRSRHHSRAGFPSCAQLAFPPPHTLWLTVQSDFCAQNKTKPSFGLAHQNFDKRCAIPLWCLQVCSTDVFIKKETKFSLFWYFMASFACPAVSWCPRCEGWGPIHPPLPPHGSVGPRRCLWICTWDQMYLHCWYGSKWQHMFYPMGLFC